MSQELNDQEIERRQSLNELRELGIEPFPAALYPVNITSKAIKTEYKEEDKNLQEVCIAGRLMSRRIMGKASFAEIMDHEGRIQVYLNRDELCPDEDKTTYIVDDTFYAKVYFGYRLDAPKFLTHLNDKYFDNFEL